jgi:acyl carrier protein|tara:strand:+ start:1093 stop:1323 length:231 start_codon:yes stop_codon:yes gene_type:complete
MDNTIEDRIKSVMSAVLEVPIQEINDKSSSDTVVSWDSLKHMNLVIALEEEFEMEFSESEIPEITNYRAIKKVVSP